MRYLQEYGSFHILRACTLVQKKNRYTPGVSVRAGVHVSLGVRVGVHMQNVKANVKVIEFQSLCIFSWILTFTSY